MNPDDGTPGNKPPASLCEPAADDAAASQDARPGPHRGREFRPGWADDDYAVVDPDIAKRVGRIYPEVIRGERKWLWFLQTEPAPPPNSGMVGSIEEAKAQFKRRYAEGRTAFLPIALLTLHTLCFSSLRPLPD